MKKTLITETFRSTWWASGATGFDGEGYKFHRLIKPLLPEPGNITFVSKTITAKPRLNPEKGEGNMPLDSRYMPKHWFPKAIYATPHTWINGCCLNAVGLSGPGVETAFEEFDWQERSKPFMISFMPMGATRDERIEEIKIFVQKLAYWIDSFNARIAVQLNESCPNTGHDLREIGKEIYSHLDCFTNLSVPVIVKINALFSIDLAKQISKHPICYGLSPTNTIPFGQAPDWIDWKALFGTADPKQSPLAKRFPRLPDGSVDTTKAGGLSGKPINLLVLDWIRRAREARIDCHINGGGGILCPQDVWEMFKAGADSISLGTITMLRPWRIRQCIVAAKNWVKINS